MQSDISTDWMDLQDTHDILNGYWVFWTLSRRRFFSQFGVRHEGLWNVWARFQSVFCKRKDTSSCLDVKNPIRLASKTDERSLKYLARSTRLLAKSIGSVESLSRM